jgi:response regulator RpfG family c-di-GMP phosphodiesterase
MTHILLVDDQPAVLHALSGICRDNRIAPSLDNPKITIFQGPCGVLEFVRHHRVDLVVANYRMVEVCGSTLLDQIGTVQPHAARIVLSVQADRIAMSRAVRDGRISGFLVKSWSAADAKHTLFEALVESRNGAEYDRGPDTVWGSEESAPRKAVATLRQRACIDATADEIVADTGISLVA